MFYLKLEKICNRIIPLLGYVTFAILPALCVLSPRLFGTLVPILGLLLYFTLCIQQRKILYPGNTPLFLFIAVGTVFLSSLFWAIDLGDAIERIFKVTLILFSGILLMTFCAETRQDNIDKYLKALYKPIILCLLLLILECWLSNPIFRFFRGLSFDAPVPPNVTNHGAIILSLFIWPLLHMFTKQNIYKYGVLLFAITFVIFIFFTRSETALLALILSFLVWQSSRLLPRFTFASVSFMAIITLYVMPWAAQWGFQHIEPTLLEKWRGSNALPRFEIWDFVARYVMQSPITGYGIEAAKNITDFDNQHIYFKGKTILHPHNCILQIWLELGLIGIVLFNAIIVAVLIKIRKLSGVDRDIALALFTSVFAISLTGYSIWQSWWLGALFFAIALFMLSQRFSFPIDKITLPFAHKKRGSC